MTIIRLGVISMIFTLIICFGLTACSNEKSAERTAMEAYKQTLLNEVEFFDADNKNFVYFNMYYQYMFCDDRSADKDCPIEFAVVDLDSDGISETVLDFIGPYIRLVLHYKDGTVHGYQFGIKGLGTIKQDGTFGWGYATNYGWSNLKFSGESYEYIDLASFEYTSSPIGVGDSEYYETWEYIVDNTEVTEEEFIVFETAQREKKDVEWHELTEENILNYVN
jgi:hypothetical protein